MQSNSKGLAIKIAIVFGVLFVALLIYFGLHKKTVVEPVKVAEVVATSTYKIIGTSVQGRKIESYTYGSGTENVVFVGGIHGGYEWNSVLLAYQLMDYLKNNPKIIPEKLKITIIPTLNPDGVYGVTGKDGRFAVGDVSTSTKILAAGRFNAHAVDLNRNFDCRWQPKGTWQSKTTSAGTEAFSEPEAMAFKSFVLENNPSVVVFWHSASGGVYASSCKKGILPGTSDLMNYYSKASGYPAVKTFDAYPVTGAADDWLASINIPAVSVELKTHEAVEWDKNLAGVKELLEFYGNRIGV